jgi:hypothetical protein
MGLVMLNGTQFREKPTDSFLSMMYRDRPLEVTGGKGGIEGGFITGMGGGTGLADPLAILRAVIMLIGRARILDTELAEEAALG